MYFHINKFCIDILNFIVQIRMKGNIYIFRKCLESIYKLNNIISLFIDYSCIPIILLFAQMTMFSFVNIFNISLQFILCPMLYLEHIKCRFCFSALYLVNPCCFIYLSALMRHLKTMLSTEKIWCLNGWKWRYRLLGEYI